jgi:hypothetical protein
VLHHIKLGAWAGEDVNWVARGVSLPVLGTVFVDLQFYFLDGNVVEAQSTAKIKKIPLKMELRVAQLMMTTKKIYL